MSYATVALPRLTAHPDGVRIVALSAAISLNLVMLLVALRPLAAQLIRPAAPQPPLTLIWHSPPPELPPPPALPQLNPLPHVVPNVSPAVPVKTVEVAEPSTFSKPMPPAVSVPHTITAITANVVTPARTSPAETTLAYLQAPAPIYPTQARRMHMQGTVILRVRVDTSGHPLDVQVENSSGYPVLDRTARLQVLQHWRFQPAEVDGHAVSAWARVPVNFSLHDL